MPLTGELIVGGARARSSLTFRATQATTAQWLDPPFCAADSIHVVQACDAAWAAFRTYRDVDLEQRARFLEAIAEEIVALGDELTSRASAESGFPVGRLINERGRTTGQLRMFAAEIRRGGWLDIRVDPSLPDRSPQPRPDLRMYKVPLGPVAIFGASNFPLAFSVAGGDTAAALAAGCPVVVKGHPAHPGTSELVASAIVLAAQRCGIPPGVFSLLNGESHALGVELVRHPHIRAVGFTGSRAGGLALIKAASERAEPIPVYAEMSSINPVVLLPGALTQNAEILGQAFVASLTLGTGQFCTNPGIVIGLDGPALRRFMDAAAATVKQVVPTAMLTQGIHNAYESRSERLLNHTAVELIGRGIESNGVACGRAAIFSVDSKALAKHPELLEEIFGPASLVVRCASKEQVFEVLDRLEGQLTASLHFVDQDIPLIHELLGIIEGKVGRLVANGWPTGVEVSHAMVHGGPFPATSDGRSTSVGTLAIERFLRPVCYQDFPEPLLPAAVRDGNFRKRPHRYDGEYCGIDQR